MILHWMCHTGTVVKCHKVLSALLCHVCGKTTIIDFVAYHDSTLASSYTRTFRKSHYFQIEHFAWLHTSTSGHWHVIDADISLLPIQCKTISWTNGDLLSSGPLGASESWITTWQISFEKFHLDESSVKYQPFCSGLRGLKNAHDQWDAVVSINWHSDDALGQPCNE